jgi:hypothetical protein
MKQYWQHISGRWWRFSSAERHQIVAVVCGFMILCYGLFLWHPGHKKLGDLVYKEQKQNVRKRTSAKGDAALKRFNLDGLDAQVTHRELEKVRETLAGLEAEQARLLERFVPLDDLETLQSLKSELARLAESGDMEVTVLEHIYFQAGDRDRPPTPELLKKASESSPYKRPLLRLRARASYRGLMQFLLGLSSLSRVAAPVWSDISVKVDKARQRGGNQSVFSVSEAPRQWLEVEIHLAI